MSRRRAVLAALAAGTWFAGALAAAPVRADEPVGVLLYTAGEAQLVRNLEAQELQPRLPVMVNDTMRAPIEARMKAVLDDDSVLMVWEDTEIRLSNVIIDFVQSRRIIEIELITGNLRLLVPEFLGRQSVVRIKTPSARIEFDAGGDVVIRHRPAGDHTEVIGLAGRIQVQNLFADYAGAATLEPQQTTVVGTDGAPSAPVYMEREAFDGLMQQLWWVLPEPVPNWDEFFPAKLEELGVAAFGRVRRLAARPLIPVRNTSEGLARQNVPERPGDMLPEPKGTVRVRWTYDDSEVAP